jgi:hypothetical protein
MKMAETMYPPLCRISKILSFYLLGKTYIKRHRKILCRFECRSVSKMESRIRPTAPTIAAMIERIESVFWTTDVLRVRRPV